MILEENIHKFQDVLEYHKLGYKGQGIVFCAFDGFLDTVHGRKGLSVIEQLIPLASIIEINANDKDSVDRIEKMHSAIDIINMSVSAKNPFSAFKFLPLMDNGTPIICSAGNDYANKVSHPGYFSFTIAIGSRIDGEVPDYSNNGPKLDAVTDTDVWVEVDGEKYLFNGTSAACFVASCRTIVYMSAMKELGLKGKWTNEEVRAFIHVNSSDMGPEGRDNESGYGYFRLPSPPRKGEVAMFKDIKGHWAEEDIKLLAEHGLIEGDGRGNYNPEAPFTKAMYATIKAKELRKELAEKK